MNGQCEISGEGIDYIAQISVDGGASWFPKAGEILQVQAGSNSVKTVLIPALTDKKRLLVGFRDYPLTDGLAVTNYTFANSI